MKKNMIIILSGFIILIVFTIVIGNNIKLMNEDNDDLMNITGIHYIADQNVGSIESWNVKDDKLVIKTKGNVLQYCVKSTKTDPSENDFCWKDIDDNKGTSSIYHNKRYYVWIRDEYDILGDPIVIDNN